MRINLTADGLGLDLTKPPYRDEGLTLSITGNKGAGKSNTLAVIAEELHANHIPFFFYDPNGDCVSLRELGDDVIIIGDPNHDEAIRRADYPLYLALREASDFVRMALNDGYSFALDLTDNNPDIEEYNPLGVFTALIHEHYRQAGKLRTPCAVIVDEAHCFAPQSGADKAEQAARRALGRVATDGRKRGMMLIAATQRATYLDKRIIFGANVRMFGKCTYWPDYEATKHYFPHSFQQMKALQTGEVVIVADGNFGKVRIKVRHTTDLGKTPAFKPRARKARPSKVKQLGLPLEES